MALRALAYINLINAVILFCAAILIFVPAPHYMLWLAGVGASEMPLQIVVSALVLLAVSLALVGAKRHRLMASASAMLAIQASLLALFDIGAIYNYAGAKDYVLSAAEALSFQGATGQVQRLEPQEYAKSNGQSLYVDIYEPATTLKRPAVVVIHGGSWRSGRRSDYVRYNSWLAMQGYTVFDIDYRLSKSDVHFPAPVQDIELALEWINTHADKYHVDGNRIALLGRSAGAQLALVSAYQTRSKNDSVKPIRCVVSLYGPTDLTWNYHHPVEPDVINSSVVLKNYLGGSPEELPALYAQASPVNLIGDQTPPTLFLHGGRDQVVSAINVERMKPSLDAHKIPYEYCFLPWANHGFDWHFNGFSSQMSKDVMAKFLRKYLGNET